MVERGVQSRYSLPPPVATAFALAGQPRSNVMELVEVQGEAPLRSSPSKIPGSHIPMAQDPSGRVRASIRSAMHMYLPDNAWDKCLTGNEVSVRSSPRERLNDFISGPSRASSHSH